MKNNEHIVKSKKKIKLSTLKFFYEISSIPAEIREKYLQKLLTCPVKHSERKNSRHQKNVRLLKEIYKCIENDRISDWEEERICHLLNISKNMLYCHKHYILKGIRELFFNWEQVERRELKNDKQNTDDITYKFKRAILMNDIGMTREAKDKFIKICKIVEVKKNRNINDEIILLKSYEKLCFYYFHQKNRFKFNLFHSKIKNKGNKLLKSIKVKKNDFIISEINIILYHGLIKKLGFNIKEQNSYPQIIDLYKKIYVEAKKINNLDLVCKVLTNIGSIYQDLMQFDKAVEYYKKGLRFTNKRNMRTENIIFVISITAVEYFSDLLSFQECLNKITKLYNNLNGIYLKNYIKERILFQFFCIGTVSNRVELLYGFLKEYNSYNLIVNGYKSTMRMLYYEKFTYYLSKIFKYKYAVIPNSSGKLIVVSNTNKDIIKRLEDLEVELLYNFDKRYTIYFTFESYMFMLETEFCKGRDMNFEKFSDIYNKIKWLLKTRNKIFQNDYELYNFLSLIKLCTQVIEDSKYLKVEEIYKKFGQNFDSFSFQLFNEKKENIIPYFTFISFAAEQSFCKKLKDISNRLFFTLDKKYSDIFAPIKKQIEEQANNPTKETAD
jgi:hypothetical protein